jgi:hypothetical protein
VGHDSRRTLVSRFLSRFRCLLAPLAAARLIRTEHRGGAREWTPRPCQGESEEKFESRVNWKKNPTPGVYCTSDIGSPQPLRRPALFQCRPSWASALDDTSLAFDNASSAFDDDSWRQPCMSAEPCPKASRRARQAPDRVGDLRRHSPDACSSNHDVLREGADSRDDRHAAGSALATVSARDGRHAPRSAHSRSPAARSPTARPARCTTAVPPARPAVQEPKLSLPRDLGGRHPQLAAGPVLRQRFRQAQRALVGLVQ